MNFTSRASIVEQLEPRTFLSSGAPTTAFALGTINNVFAFSIDPRGTQRTTKLAGRRVFDDANNNGRLDNGESVAVTDLEGYYRLTVTRGQSHIVRLVGENGWAVTAGKRSVARFDPPTDPRASWAAGPDFYEAMVKPVRIDVAVAYTALADRGRPVSHTNADVASLIANANRPYANSNTNVFLNLVAEQHTGYRESTSIHTDLQRLAKPGDTYFDDVLALRERTKADVTLLLTTPTSKKDAVGTAYGYAPKSKTVSETAFCVVRKQDGPGSHPNGKDWATVAHEIGHILGAGHDPENQTEGIIAKYAHGYIFKGDDNRNYKDVMSYGTELVLPYFSSPDFIVADKPIGDAKTADNARVIREIAPTVSRNR